MEKANNYIKKETDLEFNAINSYTTASLSVIKTWKLMSFREHLFL